MDALPSEVSGGGGFIKCNFSLVFCVSKCLRAHGECLGIESRRRTWEAAICLGELSTER